MNGQPVWDRKNPIAPFRPDGSLMHYPMRFGYGEKAEDPRWVKVIPWHDILTLWGIERGQSAARFIWRGTKGQKYPMMMADMLILLETSTVRYGVVEATWTVTKRGQNYGIKAVKRHG